MFIEAVLPKCNLCGKVWIPTLEGGKIQVLDGSLQPEKCPAMGCKSTHWNEDECKPLDVGRIQMGVGYVR